MTSRWIVVSLGSWGAFLIAAGIWASVVNGYLNAAQLTGAVVLCSVGLLLTSKVPQNRVSWLLLVSGVMTAWLFLGISVEPDQWLSFFPDPVVRGFVWSGNFIWLIPILLLITTVFLFPTGHMPSMRWRPVAAIGLLASVLLVSGLAFEQGGYEMYPFGPPLELADADLFLLIPGFALVLIFAAGSMVSLFVRYRSSGGEEKAQIRWVLYASAVALAAYALGNLFANSDAGDWDIIMFIVIAAVPVAIAVAILRYRLYDIDKIVNRTVTYTVVVGTLAIVFITGAVWLPQLLPAGSNALVVAASTLAVAALFNPVRRRVQHIVDRRFNRLPYDPATIAEDFGLQVRDGVDADDLARFWMKAAVDSLEPSVAGVWMRPTT